jgi:hypothetical protein
VPSSVWPGEDRDELSHLRTLVSLERVLGGLVDQVLALSLELLDQLLPESRKRVPDRLFQRTDAFLGHARLPLSWGRHASLPYGSHRASSTPQPLRVLNGRLAVRRGLPMRREVSGGREELQRRGMNRRSSGSVTFET